MSSSEVFASTPLNRRQFVKLAGGATLSLSALLAACGGSGPQASPAACKTAMAAQLAASESGSQAAKNAPMPPQCAGLAPSVTQSIAAQVVSSAFEKYLGGQS